MKRLLAAFIAFITLFSVLSMTACQGNDAPKGMQLVRGGEDVGYNFWGPEEWAVSNYGNIACTFASKIDMSSMTFVETEKPASTIAEYFESEKTKFPYEITVSVDGEDCNFGNANKNAKKYIYSYTYKDFSYTCMQIFVTNSDRFYIFTYTASNVERSEGKSYYEYYLDKVTAVIDAFEFTGTPIKEDAEKNYEYDSDGYKLISDKTLAGFKMYVPDSFKVDYASSLVSASHTDGTNFTMAQATYTGVYSTDYWEARKKNINSFANNSLVEIEVGKEVNLEDIVWAFSYEYTYVFEGVTYHVYQVQIVASATTGYVFTYTATEELYNTHLTEMEKVLNKFEY